MNTCNGSHTTQMLDLDVVHSTVQCFLALSHDFKRGNFGLLLDLDDLPLVI